ncbi:hypothetical protein ACFLTU_07080 [Bacteroidota bacterium]
MNETMKLPEEFHPLNREEMHEVQGGFLGAVLIGLAIAGGAAIINDWDNFKNGLMGRPEVR